MKKSKYKPFRPYENQPHIVPIELTLNGKHIKPGTLLKIKHDRTAWTFLAMYHNMEKDVQWVDLRSPMGFRSVRPEKLAGEFIQKKSRLKKSD